MDGAADDKDLEKVPMEDEMTEEVVDDFMPDAKKLADDYAKMDEQRKTQVSLRPAFSGKGLTLEEVAEQRHQLNFPSHRYDNSNRGYRGGRGSGRGRGSPDKTYHNQAYQNRYNWKGEDFGGHEQENSCSRGITKRNGEGHSGNNVAFPHYDELRDTSRNEQKVNFPPEVLPWTKQKTTVTFGNLRHTISSQDVQDLCSVYGEVCNSRVITDKDGTPTGYAVADFLDRIAAEKAVLDYDRRTLDGQPLMCVINEDKVRPSGQDQEGKRDIHARLGPKFGQLGLGGSFR